MLVKAIPDVTTTEQNNANRVYIYEIYVSKNTFFAISQMMFSYLQMWANQFMSHHRPPIVHNTTAIYIQVIFRALIYNCMRTKKSGDEAPSLSILFAVYVDVSKSIIKHFMDSRVEGHICDQDVILIEKR